MSRSGKSELSPSITKPSDSINLDKNGGGVDMGRKSEPSVTSGGLGVSTEITNIGGVSVTGGVSVDISPIDLGINYDPSENSLGIAGGAEIPGGLLGISGGVTVNLDTGEVTGGQVGAEGLGLGVNISASKDGGLGVEFTVQIPFTPIELGLGFGFPPRKKPIVIPPPLEKRPGVGSPAKDLPEFKDNCLYYVVWLKHPVGIKMTYSKPLTRFGNHPYYSEGIWGGGGEILKQENMAPGSRLTPAYIMWHDYPTRPDRAGYKINGEEGFAQLAGFGNQSPAEIISEKVAISYPYNGAADYLYDYGPDIKKWMNIWVKDGGWEFSVIQVSCIGDPPDTPPVKVTPIDKQNSPGSAPPPPFPNPPPRKRNNMNDCCREAIALARANRRFLQEIVKMMGRPLDSKGNLAPIPANAKFFGEPIERIKTPIKDINNPEKEILKFNNYYQLQMYQLGQQINLDVGIDPQSFVAPSGKIQNPSYERHSETSLETNVQPEQDEKGNKRELVIGEDIQINSLAQQQQYLFEAVKRLEYLFPYGELADAKFAKSLIIPGATGELKVHNLIHFKEFLVQFLNATLGNPKISIKIEDNNALKEGKQEATFNHFSISHMIRELYKIVLESGDDINAIMETTIRDFRTNLANRIQIIQIAEMTQALVEDTGMLENQVFIPVKLDGDPYAGKWKAGVGFEPDKDLDSNTEAATEKLMKATLKNFMAQVKVIRRDKRENADTRDLLIQLAEMFIRATAIPATKEGIEKALTAARTKVRVDNAISRTQVRRAAAAKLSRTKKRKKQ